MQVSIEATSGLERKMTIAVPRNEVDLAVKARLQEAAKSVRINGFRKGKVPMGVIKNRYGKGVRQEVVGELMSQSYYRALSQKSIRPAGQPRIEATRTEEGQDLEFTAVFEVYPEVNLPDFSALKLEKLVAVVDDENIDKMITTLREQRQTWEKAGRAAELKDMVNIDYAGSIDGAAFAGGKAKGAKIVLGSNRMIPGFEEGLVGKTAGETVTLDLQFPEQYHNAELAGQATQFEITINEVLEQTLPELNDAFYASFGIDEGGESAFRDEVRQNMEREMKSASRNKLKQSTVERLIAVCEVVAPKALLDAEIVNLRNQAIQQMGGGKNIDPQLLPDELFREQAQRRVVSGLILSEVIKQQTLEPDPAKVRTAVEEIASTYESPDEVVKWYYANPEQLASVESAVLEDQVFDYILSLAKVTENSVSYERVIQVESRDNSPTDSAAPNETANAE